MKENTYESYANVDDDAVNTYCNLLYSGKLIMSSTLIYFLIEPKIQRIQFRIQGEITSIIFGRNFNLKNF